MLIECRRQPEMVIGGRGAAGGPSVESVSQGAGCRPIPQCSESVAAGGWPRCRRRGGSGSTVLDVRPHHRFAADSGGRRWTARAARPPSGLPGGYPGSPAWVDRLAQASRPPRGHQSKSSWAARGACRCFGWRTRAESCRVELRRSSAGRIQGQMFPQELAGWHCSSRPSRDSQGDRECGGRRV